MQPAWRDVVIVRAPRTTVAIGAQVPFQVPIQPCNAWKREPWPHDPGQQAEGPPKPHGPMVDYRDLDCLWALADEPADVAVDAAPAPPAAAHPALAAAAPLAVVVAAQPAPQPRARRRRRQDDRGPGAAAADDGQVCAVAAAALHASTRARVCASARAKKAELRSRRLATTQSRVVETVVNSSLALNLQRGRMHLKRDSAGNLMIGGKRGMRAREGSAKRRKIVSQTALRANLQLLAAASEAKGSFSTEAKLSIAFMSSQISSIAQAYRCDRKTVRRFKIGIASVSMGIQESILGALRSAIAAAPPDYAGCFLMWDETGQRVAHPEHKEHTFQIMVLKATFVWGWLAGSGDRRSRSVDLLIPPMVVPTTSANAIWNALHLHPHAARVLQLRGDLLKAAKMGWDVHCIDAASGNVRLEAHDHNISPADRIKDYFLCRSHQNHLIYGSLMGVCFKLSFLNDMFATSNFLRMGCHFLRLTACVHRFVKEQLDIIRSPPPDVDVKCAAELKEYLIANFRAEATVSIERQQTPASGKLIRKNMDLFFEMCNGGFATSSSRLVHYCGGRDCCKSRADSIDRMTKALLTFPLRAPPPVPSNSRWTKTGPTVDCYLVGNMYRLFYNLTLTAMSPFKMEQAAARVDQADDPGEWSEDVDWHMVAGKRYMRARGFLGDPSRFLLVNIFAVVFEPLRILCSYFLEISWHADRSRQPPLINLLNPRLSKLIAVQQYFSTLLAGRSNRLILVWRFFGCNSLDEFLRTYPSQALMLRRSALLAAGGVYRRYQRYLARWSHFGVADSRRPRGERAALCEQLLSCSPCCLRPESHRRLKLRLQAELPGAHADMLPARIEKFLSWQPMLLHVAWVIKLSIAEVEREHAKNKRRTHPQGMVSLMAAESVLGQLRSRHAAFLRGAKRPQGLVLLDSTQPGLQPQLQPSPVGGRPDQPGETRPLKAQSALQIYRSDFIKEEIAAGRWKGQPTGKVHWDTVREKYTALPRWRQENYEQRANASRGLPKSNYS